MLERANEGFTDVVHGFSNRLGGVSEGHFASLNLGKKWGDDPTAVDENRRRLAAAGGFGLERLVQVRQVHGRRVVRAAEVDADTEADAIWTTAEEGLVVAVSTADCVPVLLVDEDRRVCAAIHSGWRSTVADIVGATVDVLTREAGIDPASLRAAIGPCIELDAFEVGPEVAAQFDVDLVAIEGYAKPHVDLVGAVRRQLAAAGLEPSRIVRVGACTHANPDTYFSYRRDGTGTGQHLSFIGL